MKCVNTFAFILALFVFCVWGVPSQSLAQSQDRSDELPGIDNSTATWLLVGGIALATTGAIWAIIKKNNEKQEEETKEKGEGEKAGDEESTSLSFEDYRQHQRGLVNRRPLKVRVGIHPATLKPALGLTLSF